MSAHFLQSSIAETLNHYLGVGDGMKNGAGSLLPDKAFSSARARALSEDPRV